MTDIKLLQIAAALVSGRYSLPYCQEDYDKSVPKWVLKRLETQRDKHRVLGIEVRNVYDNLRQKAKEDSKAQRMQEAITHSELDKLFDFIDNLAVVDIDNWSNIAQYCSENNIPYKGINDSQESFPTQQETET